MVLDQREGRPVAFAKNFTDSGPYLLGVVCIRTDLLDKCHMFLLHGLRLYISDLFCLDMVFEARGSLLRKVSAWYRLVDMDINEAKDSHKRYAIVGLLLVVAIGFLAWAAQSFLGGEAAAVRSLERDKSQVPVESVFENKIVYTTDVSFPADIFQDDCLDRGGEFDQCGTPCDAGEVCAAVCAYTCSF